MLNLQTQHQSSKRYSYVKPIKPKAGTTEEFEWVDTDVPHGIGDRWQSTETSVLFEPSSSKPFLALRNRDTRWYDVDIKWVSKYGIINPAGTDASTATANVFVPNDGTVSLNPYFDDGSAVSGRTNVTLANNEGVVTRISHTIDIEFSNTTFPYKHFNKRR